MKEVVINCRPYEKRVALLEDGKLCELYLERKDSEELVGNIYKGKVVKVLPGMQAAFLDIGINRTGFLSIQDMNPDPEIPAHIEEILSEGDQIMVQVAKDSVGNKGPRLKTNITLPGRRLVLLPFTKGIGVSKKIKERKERERLRNIVEKIRPEEFGFIVRTVSEGETEEKLKREMEFLLRLWDEIKKKMETYPCPSLLYKEVSLSLKAVRDLLTKDVDFLVIDSKEEYSEIMRFIDSLYPGLRDSIRLYSGKEPIFDYYGIEDQIKDLFEKKIQLKSGGYIVIEKTEALTAIDVNTGSYVGEKDLEQTALKTNLEAAEEIARQVKVRNISGLIVIDFIDMKDKENREKVFLALKEAFSKDRAKTNILHMSELGIVEMTRERGRTDLNEVLLEECPYCKGKGSVKSKQTVCYEIFREIERRSFSKNQITVSVNPEVAFFMREREKESIDYLEKKLNKKISILPKEEFHIEKFEIS